MGSKNAKPGSKNSTSISPTENLNSTKQQLQQQNMFTLEQLANNNTYNGPNLAVRLNEELSDDVFFNNRIGSTNSLIGQILDKNNTSPGRFISRIRILNFLWLTLELN